MARQSIRRVEVICLRHVCGIAEINILRERRVLSVLRGAGYANKQQPAAPPMRESQFSCNHIPSAGA